MEPIKDLEGIEEQTLSGAGEAVQILGVKSVWVAHRIVSYTLTRETQDLVECERILLDMKGEIDKAMKSVGDAIREESNLISREQMEAVGKDSDLHV